MTPFTESAICHGGEFCDACRQQRAFRRSLRDSFTLPDDDVDFACPHGKGAAVVLRIQRGVPIPKPSIEFLQRQRSLTRPGDLVAIVLTRMGYSQKPGCGCAAFQRKMNAWGWRQCWRRRQEILAWFVTKARAKGVVLGEESFYELFKAGAKFARQGQSSQRS